jgi:hypothetical protein
VQSYVEEHPEISNERVEPAIVVVGPQRSGTSKLFRMIAADPQWTKLYTWQAFFPVPLGSLPADGVDPRIALAERMVEQLQWLQPAHEMDARSPEMEAVLMNYAFMTNSPTRLVPSHQRYLETGDYGHVYAWLDRMLQFIQWQNDGPRTPWVLKSTTHLPSLGALAKRYPNATLVMTHRHPRTSVASMLKLVELGTEANARSVDLAKVREVWLRILKMNLTRFLEFRDANGSDNWVDVPYNELRGHSTESVRRIYEQVGVPFTSETEAVIAAWEREHPQHRVGEFNYQLEDYGLIEEDIEREFAPYIERFGHLF